MGMSPKTKDLLVNLGNDAVHLHNQGLDRLPDSDILEKARNEGRVLLTNDLDFSELLAVSKAKLPSVIIFRLHNMHPKQVNKYLHQIINQHRTPIEEGAIISVTEGSVRIRLLPLSLKE